MLSLGTNPSDPPPATPAGGEPPAAPAAQPAGDPAQPPAAPATPSIIGENGEFAANWFRSVEGLEGEGGLLGRFKTPQDLAKSYSHLNKTKAMVPMQDSTPEQVAAFRQANNIPDEIRNYELALPEEGLPQGVEMPDGMLDSYKQAFIDNNIPVHVGQALLAKHLELTGGMAGDQMQMLEQQFAQDKQALQQEWGLQFDGNLEQASHACLNICREAGIDPKDVPYANDPVFAKMMFTLSKMVSESALSNGVQNPIGQAAGGAAEAGRIQTDPSHPDHEAYKTPDHPRHTEVVNRVAMMFNR